MQKNTVRIQTLIEEVRLVVPDLETVIFISKNDGVLKLDYEV